MAARAPTLRDTLRRFCLGAFALLHRELDAGAELTFVFEEHRSPGRPALYEYRPLAEGFVGERVDRLAELEDTRIALEELARLPQAKIFARAHAVHGAPSDDALFRTVLLPLLVKTAERCGGFDWDDGAFAASYTALERSLFAEQRAYAALAPLVGLSAPTPVDVGPGMRIRMAEPGELASYWPQAAGLLPKDFGREPDRLLVVELQRPLPADRDAPPDAPGEISDAVTAIRLATEAAVAAGPIVFERLDWRPLGIRPVLPIAATQPRGEPTRLDAFRGRLARELLARLPMTDDDPELGDALDRWELALFADEPLYSEQLRSSLASLLGGGNGLHTAALRASVLLGETPRDRVRLLDVLRPLAAGASAKPEAAQAVRRAVVEALMHGNRAGLVTTLDEALLGARPRPSAHIPAKIAAG